MRHGLGMRWNEGWPGNEPWSERTDTLPLFQLETR